MTESEAVLHVLREARRLVARSWGWIQHDYYRYCSCCADGALLKACRIKWRERDEYESMRSEWLHDWNDAPGRTQAEVVALFDKAIEDATAEVVADRLLARFEKAVTP